MLLRTQTAIVGDEQGSVIQPNWGNALLLDFQDQFFFQSKKDRESEDEFRS